MNLIQSILVFFVLRHLRANFPELDVPPPVPPASLAFGVILPSGVLSFTETEGARMRPSLWSPWREARKTQFGNPRPVVWSNVGDTELLAYWHVAPTRRLYSYSSCGDRVVVGPWNATFALQRAVAQGRAPSMETLEWLSARYGVQYTITADGYLCDEDDTQYCDLSEETYSPHADFASYNVSGGRWNRGEERQGETEAVESLCFYCDLSREYFLSEDFTAIECDGDTLCLERCEDDVYYWDSDNEYHYSPEPEEEEETGIPCYHSGVNSRFKSRAASMIGAGVELELWASDPADLYDKVNCFDLAGELDGSLDYGNSLEVISLPYTLAQWTQGETPMIKFLESIRRDGSVKGHDAGEGYGLHVSLTRALFASNLHVAKYVVAISTLEAIGKVVAQRANNYNKGFKYRSRVGGATKTEKFEPVNVQSHRVETRIFRANIRPGRIQAKVEYCFAVMQWSRDASAMDVSNEETATLSFLSFLAKAGNAKAFPHLRAMIAEKAHKFKDIAPDASRRALRLAPKVKPAIAQNGETIYVAA